MKLTILNKEGKKVKEITTSLFEEPIRKDIICKVAESEKLKQPYSPKYRAGMDRSASGSLSHRRHDWKSDRGRGLSRIPRKTMSRRGTNFNWIGAIIPSAKGGRRAHPPKGITKLKKINEKELKKALLSALSYASSVDELKNKYSSLKRKNIDKDFPLIVEDKVLEQKTKDFLESLKKILGNLYDVAIQKKSVRAGIGKMRGRKYKKNAGLLLVIGKKEYIKIKGIGVVKSDELIVSDLASNGARLTIFTENAIKELEEIKKGKKSKTDKKQNKDTKSQASERSSDSEEFGDNKDKNKEKKK